VSGLDWLRKSRGAKKLRESPKRLTTPLWPCYNNELCWVGTECSFDRSDRDQKSRPFSNLIRLWVSIMDLIITFESSVDYNPLTICSTSLKSTKTWIKMATSFLSLAQNNSLAHLLHPRHHHLHPVLQSLHHPQALRLHWFGSRRPLLLQPSLRSPQILLQRLRLIVESSLILQHGRLLLLPRVTQEISQIRILGLLHLQMDHPEIATNPLPLSTTTPKTTPK
jgi:hypothetical protein